jgi:hypothetical protein
MQSAKIRRSAGFMHPIPPIMTLNKPQKRIMIRRVSKAVQPISAHSSVSKVTLSIFPVL